MKKNNWAIIGASNIAREYMINAIASNQDSTLSTIYSQTLSRAKAFSSEYAIPNYTDDLNEILNSSEINTVYVSSYNSIRFDYVKKLLEANKHVLSEKPLCLHPKEAKTLCDIAEQQDVKLGINHHLRFSKLHNEVKKILQDGLIGNIQAVRVLHSVKLPFHLETWRLYEKKEGGVIYDIFSHDVDLIRFIANKELYFVSGVSSPIGKNAITPDSVMGLLKMEDGAIVQTHEGYTTPYAPNGYHILGSKGSIVTTGSMTQKGGGELIISSEEINLKQVYEVDNLYIDLINEYVNWIQSGLRKKVAIGSDALASCKLAFELSSFLDYD